MCIYAQYFVLSRLQTNMADFVDMAFSIHELRVADDNNARKYVF
jgi:hypothetical protein